jgi:hypothetical protein
MKVIALVPFRNEELFLPIFMRSLEGLVDVVLGFDDDSTDSSVTLFKKFGGVLLNDYPGSPLPEGKGATIQIRNKLLEFGRKIGGTHFLIIDCDEIIIGAARTDFKQIANSLKPGEYLKLNLVTTWNNFNTYISYPDLRGPREMSFLFADRPDLIYPENEKFVHFDRIPRSNDDKTTKQIKHNVDQSAVLHLSYIGWERAQLKQSWYRVTEKEVLGRSSLIINETYRFTMNNTPPTDCLNPGMIPEFLDNKFLALLKSFKAQQSWHLEEIQRILKRNTWSKFINLEIWHVKQIRESYKAIFGFFPNPTHYTRFHEAITLKINHIRYMCNKLNGNKS